MADLIDNQTDPTLAPYAKTGEVTLRLSTKSSNQEEANQVLDILENQILNRQTFEGISLRDLCYGYGEESSLPSIVVEELKKARENYHCSREFDGRAFPSHCGRFSGASSIFRGWFRDL